MVELDVFLESDAFVTMTVAVAEGFKSEVGGLLFGDEFPSALWRKILVSQTIPLQTAVRKPGSVEYHPWRTSLVKGLWEDLTSYWPVGGFHSHPEYGGTTYDPVPSDGDRKCMKPGEIEVIVSVKEALKHDQLGYKREGLRISGAVGDFHVEIAAWYCDDEGEITEAELWCPYIQVVNMAYDVGITFQPGRLYERYTVVRPRTVRTLRRLVRKHERQVFKSMDDRSPVLSDIRRKLKEIKRYDGELP